MVARTPQGIEPALLKDAIGRMRTVPPDGEAARMGRAARHQLRQRGMVDAEKVW